MEKINIVGWGFVGQATGIGLKRLGYDVVAYDIKPKANIYKEKEFNEIPMIVGEELPKDGINIVCIADKVENGKQSVEHIKPVLDKLGGTIILRTTILPRLLKDLKFDFYWVEFLHVRGAVNEFLKPDRVVVGKRGDKEFPFKEFDVYYCSPEEASHIKYLSNAWNALRIAFTNEYGDNLLTEEANMENIIDYFFQGQKYLKWGNAFGGFCLPKDTEAYLGEYPFLTIFDAMIKSNNKHKKDHPELEYNPIY